MQDELVAIFLKGLHPVFQQLQVWFAVPKQMPATLDEAVATVRKFDANPTIAVELAKLRSPGSSQTMFAVVPQTTKTRNCPQWVRMDVAHLVPSASFSIRRRSATSAPKTGTWKKPVSPSFRI